MFLLLPSLVIQATTTSVTLNNGVVMPVVAAGTWQYSAAAAEQSVAAALSVGIRHIDTAHDYCADGSTADCTGRGGSNQVGIAKALAASSVPRSEIFITTKVPPCGNQGITRAACAADSLKAAQKNLDELGVGYVDLLLVHFPPIIGGCGPVNCGVIREQWRALAQVLAANKTRAVGVSNFCESCFRCLAGDAGAIVPAVNQFEYHIGMGADPIGLVSYCKANGVMPQAYSPLGDNTTELISGPLVNAIGGAHGKSGVQVALKWIWSHGVAVTTKSSSPVHLAEDLDLFDWQLTPAEMAKADASSAPKGKPSFACSA